MKKTCNNCGWFVYETETVGDWQHSEAVKRQKGFCEARKEKDNSLVFRALDVWKEKEPTKEDVLLFEKLFVKRFENAIKDCFEKNRKRAEGIGDKL